MKPIAIVGLGGIFPKALDVAAYWRNILQGRDCVVEVPAERWDWRLYWDADPKAADKTYSKIGGFVEGFVFEPLRYRIPPPVAAQMDPVQQLAIAATQQAVTDAALAVDPERVAVIFGNSMGGAKKEASDHRVYTARTLAALERVCARAGIPAAAQAALRAGLEEEVKRGVSAITEDSMPGELSNVIAGRLANVFNFNGPSFTVDAACASSLAAVDMAVQGLRAGTCDAAVCGGVDQMMSPPAYVKFSKIGALSPDGSRPFDARANGFVMGEGAGVFVLKRLADAEKAGDRVYAVIRSIGSSSDGKGKGITAPNPKGQALALQRAYAALDYAPQAVGLVEAHGTSTPVGDAVEVGVLAAAFASAPRQSVALGSVKSQIGHLKAAAGAAGLIKAALALQQKVLPPSIHFETPNPKADFPNTAFHVNTAVRPWETTGKRRAGVSAFGFGGTNFHVALEEAGAGPRLVDPRLVSREPFDSAQGGRPALPEEVATVARGKGFAAFAAESAEKLKQKRALLDAGLPESLLRAKGVYLSKSRRPKIAFLFPGQGSQYVDMLRDLKARYPVVQETFDEADRVLASALGRSLSSVVFTPSATEEGLKATEYTQPAVLTADVAILRLLRSFGVEPDVVCGHSLGEYGALVAAGVMTFEDALHAVCARAKEMAGVQVPDPGKMASVALSAEKAEARLAGIPGYVAVANKNCPSQTVIAGATAAVAEALRRFKADGIAAQEIAVSHAFHSRIVAPAQAPYRRVLERLKLQAPKVPILSNVTADYYPQDAAAITDLLVRQIAAPVEFIRQVQRLRADGVTLFVEVGPKRVLTAFVTSTLEGDREAAAVSSNHPKRGGLVEFHDLLARLVAERVLPLPAEPGEGARRAGEGERASIPHPGSAHLLPDSVGKKEVVVSGLAVGAPGSWDRVFRESAADEILRGQNLIEKLPEAEQRRQIDKNIVRLVKSETGDHRLERLEGVAAAVKLAARAGEFDVEEEFGLSAGLAQALDRTSALALAAGLLALKDAGIPLVRTYRATKAGGRIPVGWALPEALREETGVIMACAFPGLDSLVDEVSRYLADQGTYQYSRDFLLKVLSMGHSQMSQFVGARGPSLQVNAACASTTLSIGLAEDWIRQGRAKRVLVIGADDITGERLQEWFLAGFLAAGAATTESAVSRAALPFDRRRHGMIVGMGAVALLVEDGAQTRRRGTRAHAEVLATEYANSAFHATRLDTAHVAEVMDRLVSRAEQRHGLDRRAIADKTLFMSHETYTPARGGSAAAEVTALQKTFGDAAGKVLVCNTKGFTGHTMGASLEDPVAILAMASGKVPPIANYREPDPELAGIRLSDGGEHDLQYALRLAAGFGSQIAMTLMRRLARRGDPLVAEPERYQGWLREVTGEAAPELETVHNTLRVKELAVPSSARSAGEGARRADEGKRASVPHPAAGHLLPGSAGKKEEILALVAEKTGYPIEMLDLDLDMEADLGIDTVKQAEIFGLIREKFELPRQEGLSLKDYPTLRHLIDYVSGSPSSARSAGEGARRADEGERTSLPHPAAGHLLPGSAGKKEILELVALKTGYPVEMLELDLDMEADLGIDTVKQAEIFGMIREKFELPRQEGLSLKDYPTLRHLIDYVNGTKSSGPSPSPLPATRGEEKDARAARPARGKENIGNARSASALLKSSPQRGEDEGEGIRESPKSFCRYVIRPVERPLPAASAARLHSGIVFVAATSRPDSLAVELNAQGLDAQVHTGDAEALFLLAQKHQKELDRDGAFLVVATTMDGAHGYAGGADPASGALTGLAKALRKELSRARVKSLDFSPKTSPAEMARAIAAELRSNDTAVEIGYRQARRQGVSLVPAAAKPSALDLRGKIVLVTGGGLGLGAELAKTLAARFQPRLVLLGRTQTAPEAASWAALDKAGLDALKQSLWVRLKAEDAKTTPVKLEREFARITKAVDLHRNLELMRASGAQVEYLPCDLADPEALKGAVARAGDVDVVVHAAGLEESRLLADKKLDTFRAVLEAKAIAAQRLVAAVPAKQGQRWLFFSSVAGRFGNLGQTDYSAANDSLCKLALQMRAQGRWACAVVLTAFSRIGMATRGSVETFLKSQGVDFLDPKTGIEMILAELLGGDAGEVVLAGSLGALDAEGQITKVGNSVVTVSGHSWVGKVGTAVTIDKTFSLEADAYLKDHAIGGTPYVPGVMGIELFLQAAQQRAGKRPASLSDIHFELPIKLLRNKPAAVRVLSEQRDGGLALKIESDFIGPGGIKLGGPRVHFRARAGTDSLPHPPPDVWRDLLPDSVRKKGFAVTADEIYRRYFHGPGFQVLRGIVELSPDTVIAEVAPLPAGAGAETVQGLPRLIEALFQACGYRDLHFDQKTALPDAIEKLEIGTEATLPTVAGYSSPRRLFAQGHFKRRDADGKSLYDASLYDAEGRVLVSLTGYRMIPIS